jgi:hypothetical protein
VFHYVKNGLPFPRRRVLPALRAAVTIGKGAEAVPDEGAGRPGRRAPGRGHLGVAQDDRKGSADPGRWSG